jgi:leucyl aminopeptidase
MVAWGNIFHEERVDMSMKVTLSKAREDTARADTLMLPVTEDARMKPYAEIDRALAGLPSKLFRSREFTGKRNTAMPVHTHGKIRPGKVLLVGLGQRDDLSPEVLRQAGGTACSFLRGHGGGRAALSAHSIHDLGLSPTAFVEGFLLADYDFSEYKKADGRGTLKEIAVLSRSLRVAEMRRVAVETEANHFARDLVNTPAKDMTPSHLERAARSIRGVRVRSIGEKEAERLGMGAYLSVASGSLEPAKFLILTYDGTKSRRGGPVVLIGKSITFDSGGLSLKPGKAMETMKYDMAGGAAVLGAFKGAAELKMPDHLVGILPATENLPGKTPSKPGDVVRSISGKSIEILNTDAEGRLILADAIEYARTFKPRYVVDLATLTGAALVALGGEAAALMGNDETLLTRIEEAGAETHERVWRMPLYEEYKSYMESDIADLRNISKSTGGLVTAGYFLKEFAGDAPWAHLDIAGVAWTDPARPYAPRGATGAGVRLLLSLLRKLK